MCHIKLLVVHMVNMVHMVRLSVDMAVPVSEKRNRTGRDLL